MTHAQKQHLLACLGYYTGAVDDLWGKASVAATMALQDAEGLTVDGVFGADTLAAALAAIAAGRFAAPVEAPPEDKTPAAPEPDPAAPSWWGEIKHFRRAEFACKCGQYHAPYCDGYPAEMQEAAVRLCDAAREHFGRPAHIISGLRCPQHNADSGGVANSQHMYGEACDLMIEGVSSGELLAWIQSRPGVRYAYAINGTNVHFDVSMGAR